MSAPGAGGRPLGAISELTYENKTCSECRQDVSKAETKAARQTDRLTERQKDRQMDGLIERQIQDRKTFQLSYQKKKLFRKHFVGMSICQNAVFGCP